MPNQQLIDYIKNQIKLGRSEDVIKMMLKNAGWQEADIEEGFKAVITPEAIQNYSSMSYDNQQGAKFITPEGRFNKKILIAIIAIFILLASSAFGFYYFDKSKIPSESTTKTSEESQGEITTLIPKSPKEKFLDSKSALENATTYEEAAVLTKQYMSKTTDTKTLGYEQINLSAEQKSQLLVMLKNTPPLIKDIIDITEEIDGTSGKLLIKTNDNKLCGLPLFLEDNQWKFGIMDCKELITTQPAQTQQQAQNLSVNTITNCGSIKYANILNIDDTRTSAETDALNCMASALTDCSPKALTVNSIQITIYQIEDKEGQYCNISKNTSLKTICRVPLTYISSQRQKYKSPNADDIFLQTIISSINAGGKITDGKTGQTTTEFICQ